MDVWVVEPNHDPDILENAGPFICHESTFLCHQFYPRETIAVADFKKRYLTLFEDFHVYVANNVEDILKRQFSKDCLTCCIWQDKHIHSDTTENVIINKYLGPEQRLACFRKLYDVLNKRNPKLVEFIYLTFGCYALFDLNEDKLRGIIARIYPEKNQEKMLANIQRFFKVMDKILYNRFTKR